MAKPTPPVASPPVKSTRPSYRLERRGSSAFAAIRVAPDGTESQLWPADVVGITVGKLMDVMTEEGAR